MLLTEMSRMKELCLILASFLCASTFAAESDHSTDENALVIHVSFDDVFHVLVFLFAVYVAGLCTKALGMPSLVGEIITGFLLGPPLADYVPQTQALVLIGEIGLIMLLLEAGVELDVAQLRQTGFRACGIAFTGAISALVVGVGVAYALKDDDSAEACIPSEDIQCPGDFKRALAVGAAFAPTSLGVAASALGSGGMLNTPVGQLIVASCVLDDMIGLIILSLFEVLVKPSPKMIEYFIPVISSIGSLIILGLPAVTFLPTWIEKSIKLPKKYHDLALFFLLSALTMLYLFVLNEIKASYLTGAFLAGATFSQVHNFHHTFKHTCHDVMTWLLRVFFAASIGFQVPVTMLEEATVWKNGIALWATCVLIKLFVVAFVPAFEDSQKGAIYNPYRRDIVVTGLSMTCRGEFSFIIAAFGLQNKLLNEEMYGSIVLAVLLSAITSPLCLMKSIAKFKDLQKEYLKSTNPTTADKEGDGKMPLFIKIHIETEGAWGLIDVIRTELHKLDLVIEDFRTSHERGVNAIITNDIYARVNEIRIAIPTVEMEKKKITFAKRLNSYSDLINVVKELTAEDEHNVTYHEDSDRSPNDSVHGKNDGTEQTSERSGLLSEREDINFVKDEIKLEAAVSNKVTSIEMTLKDSLTPFGIKALHISRFNPWDWSAALDTLNMTRSNGTQPDLNFFMTLFDLFDVDGSGSLDSDELYDALLNAGIAITREGLVAMIAAVDDNQDGEISREEWENAITLYLQKKDDESIFHL